MESRGYSKSRIEEYDSENLGEMAQKVRGGWSVVSGYVFKKIEKLKASIAMKEEWVLVDRVPVTDSQLLTTYNRQLTTDN